MQHWDRTGRPCSLRGALKAGTTRAGAVLLAVAVALVGGTAALDRAGTGRTPVEPVDPEVALIAEKRCSATGFRNDETPASALIRTFAGELRHVTFERGWAAYEGRAPGMLVAVCRTPPDRSAPRLK